MKIGEKIRKYRKEKDLSQEMLAERLGVTFQAVSRWERAETYPDITMLPALANFFGVTVDELLGTKELVEEQEVAKIIAQCQEYDTHYQGEELAKAVEEGLKKYPGNFRLMAWYVYAFQNRKPEKAIEVANYVLDNCTDNNIRGWVNSNIIYAYKNSGNLEKAIELAKQLPGYYDTSQDVLRACLTGKERLVHVQHMAMDLAYEFWYSIRQILEHYTPEEKILLFKKSNAIYDATYELDDMPVKLVRKMRNYQGMAEVSLLQNEVEQGLKYMEEAVNCAVLHDELPEVVTSKNLLFNQHPYDRNYEAQKNICKELLSDFETEDEVYKNIRELDAYKQLMEKLKSKKV